MTHKRNDSDRAQWVNNDEGLYRWMLSERKGVSRFVRLHRQEIDAFLDAVDNLQPGQSYFSLRVTDFMNTRGGY